MPGLGSEAPTASLATLATVSLSSILAAAAQDVIVRIDDGGRGLGLRDLLVPIGALLGVLLAGAYNRRTLRKLEEERAQRDEQRDRDQHARELKREEERANREIELEQDRQRRTNDASKRQTIGSVRTACWYLLDLRRNARLALRTRSKGPMILSVASPIQADDEHRMASWLSHEAWRTYVQAIGLAKLLFVGPADMRPPDAQWFRTTERIHERASAAVVALREEENRLGREVGDPDATRKWEPLPVHTWPVVAGDFDEDDDPDDATA